MQALASCDVLLKYLDKERIFSACHVVEKNCPELPLTEALSELLRGIIKILSLSFISYLHCYVIWSSIKKCIFSLCFLILPELSVVESQRRVVSPCRVMHALEPYAKQFDLAIQQVRNSCAPFWVYTTFFLSGGWGQLLFVASEPEGKEVRAVLQSPMSTPLQS